jgi:cation diffusion facilitator CzcD-associated flavoprotein CzcO/acetyl esterase/lipase
MAEDTQIETPDVDVVVVGAGFAGLYQLYKLRQLGLSARCFETADDVGGTWYWNRYPGARCDVQSIDYSYSFDPELDDEWEWSERYATQPEILRYVNFVADKHDLRRDITFQTRVDSATWDDDAQLWRIEVSPVGDPRDLQPDHTDPAHGSEVSVTARFYVMATGCLSIPKIPDIEGTERFGGDVYFTNSWPHEGVDFTGKRVAVIGTGSSGIQSIPIIAREAAELTVFQRTPNFSLPAHNGPVRPEKRAEIVGRRDEYREEAKWTQAGVTIPISEVGILQMTEEEREAKFAEIWKEGELFSAVTRFNDVGTDIDANNLLTEFFRRQIREIVHDPETAEALCPTDHPYGTKRPCLDTDYYETFNLPHVSLVNLREDPIDTVTETGIDTASRSFEFDVIVYATGFDAMTGAIVAVDITGRDGVTLKERWADGPLTYLGLTTVGFPNLFMITGPQSPSVLSNMMVSIEQHVDWITDAIEHLCEEGQTSMEPTETAETAWVQHAADFADITLYPLADSWYVGANVPGKPRVVLPYVGGVGRYRAICDDVVARDYVGFSINGPKGRQTNDGVAYELAPDVGVMLDVMAELDAPPIETLSPDEARAFMEVANAANPPGPDVGEIVDGTLPGADGDLEYRLYRPATQGPRSIVVYFHGGGWVLGDHTSDDAFCRYLCVGTDALIVSVNYRHAPEHRFPAAQEDGFAATQWIAEHAAELGGIPGQLAVAGWSAGANVAAVVCQKARDAGGPAILGQLLINPVTDGDMGRSSYEENADGYVLTRGLMTWFFDHFVDEADRDDPRIAPLRAESLAGLPPALVVTAQFDPLRDEGEAYAEALRAAGVDADHVPMPGHIHTSLTAVGVIVTADPVREQVARFLAARLNAPVPTGG